MTRAAAARDALRVGAVVGVGLVGALDEIVFHQLLQWHHFYVHTGPFWQIASDGFFHLFTTSVFTLGAVLLWNRRRDLGAVAGSRPFWGGVLLGGGGFQLFDGVVDHKILRIHPVRVGVETIWPYDLAWIFSAIVLMGAGWALWRTRLPGKPRS